MVLRSIKYIFFAHVSVENKILLVQQLYKKYIMLVQETF